MSEEKKSIVDILNELQEKKGVNHEDVFPVLGISRSTYFERIKKDNFKPHEAMALAKYFNVDYEQVFGGFFDPTLVVGEPKIEYIKAKDELIDSYRKLDQLHDQLEEALKREIKYVKALAKAGVEIPK